VLLRYVFNTGSVWSQELEWTLMSPICLFGMSYALRHGEHVRVDVLFASFQNATSSFIEFVTALISMAVCVIVIWLSWRCRNGGLHRRRIAMNQQHEAHGNQTFEPDSARECRRDGDLRRYSRIGHIAPRQPDHDHANGHRDQRRDEFDKLLVAF